MKAPRSRLMARLHQQEPIEVYRGPPGVYISEGCVRTMTNQMGLGWQTWIERPMRDHDAIGRQLTFTPNHPNQKIVGRPPDDDLEITGFTADRIDLPPTHA